MTFSLTTREDTHFDFMGHVHAQILLVTTSTSCKTCNRLTYTSTTHQNVSSSNCKLSQYTVTVWPEPIWIKVSGWWQIPTQHQSTYLRGTESASIEIPPFQTQIYLEKVPLNVNIVKQDLLHEKQFLKILWSEVWKRGFQMMLILVLLGMYFNAVVVFVASQTL